MKKLISIICTVLLLFSFSAVAYATSNVDTEEPKADFIKVTYTLEDIKDDINETNEIISRTAKLKIVIKNDTKTDYNAKEILKLFSVKAVDSINSGNYFSYEDKYSKNTNYIIEKESSPWEVLYIMEIKTSSQLWFEINGEYLKAKKDYKDFYITDFSDETTIETSVSTSATETSNATESTETSTLTSTVPITPTESNKSHTATVIIDLPDSPHTDAPIEDEIPNTGSTKAIYAAAALAIAGATALLIIKKKSDEENWT